MAAKCGPLPLYSDLQNKNVTLTCRIHASITYQASIALVDFCDWQPLNATKMKRKIQLAALLLVITGAVVSLSCNKDDNYNDQTPPTKTELLTAGPWKRTALISNPAYDWNANGVSATDVLSIMFPCEKDNFDTFKTNGTVETDEGPTKCNASDPQTWTATWVFADNETKLIFDGFDEYTLIELTATTLKYESTFEETGVTYTHVESYGH